MGIVGRNNDQDGLDDLLGSRKDESGEADVQRRGLTLDLDVRVCRTCRRELLPWQEQCPDDGGAAVRREELPPSPDPLLDRFLREGEDDVDPDT